jgi:hypothetical protein
MPYIKPSDREPFDTGIQSLLTALGESPHFEGNLNYIISKIIDGLCDKNRGYAQINRIVGVLECAKMEFYRRIATGYEDEKCDVNGDVYTKW